MLIVTPNLRFNGQCEEAIVVYQKAFDAKIGCLLRCSDRDTRDWNAELTKEQENYVYHAEIYFGGARIMMSDNDKPVPNQGVNTSCSLTVTFESADEVRRAYDEIKDGAEIVSPIRSKTYSSCHVSLIDRYGVRWSLMTEQTQK